MFRKLRILFLLIVLLLACLVAPVFAASAEPQIEWQQQFKGMKFSTVIQARDGGYLLTGTNTSATWADVVMKTDASGNVEWTRTYYIGTYYPIFTRAIQTSDGWYVLAGERNVEGYPSTAPYVNATELCVGKIDPSGTMQWSMTYIHEDGAIANDLVGFIETPDSSFLLVCNWYTFEPTDVWAWLVKTDWSGNLRWTRVMHWSGRNWRASRPIHPACFPMTMTASTG